LKFLLRESRTQLQLNNPSVVHLQRDFLLLSCFTQVEIHESSRYFKILPTKDSIDERVFDGWIEFLDEAKAD
jgi:hypothetical protein